MCSSEFEGFAETERHDVENTNEEGRGLVEDDLTASFYDNDDDDDSVDEEDEVTIEVYIVFVTGGYLCSVQLYDCTVHICTDYSYGF